MRNKTAEFSANCVTYWRNTWSSVQMCVSPSWSLFWPLPSAPPLLHWFYSLPVEMSPVCDLLGATFLVQSLPSTSRIRSLSLCAFAHWKIFSVAGLALSQFRDLNNKNLGTSSSFYSGLYVPVLGTLDRLYPWLSLHYAVNEMWRVCCS